MILYYFISNLGFIGLINLNDDDNWWLVGKKKFFYKMIFVYRVLTILEDFYEDYY